MCTFIRLTVAIFSKDRFQNKLVTIHALSAVQ